VRRDELARVGVQLPVLPTIALGALPGAPAWAARLERIGLDVVASGAAADTPETWRAARDAVPHRPVKATGGDPLALVAAGCTMLETDEEVPAGAYRLGADEDAVAGVRGADPEIEDANDVAAAVIAGTAERPPSGLWVVATRGLEGLAADAVERKLAALVEGVRLARLFLAKRQYEI
jgi:hypothetical protein